MVFCSEDFSEKSICSALSRANPQGKRRLDSPAMLENAILRCLLFQM